MINLEWNLQELFKDLNSCERDIEVEKQQLIKIEPLLKKELDAVSLQKLLDQKWQIKEKSTKILVYASLCYYKNIYNEENIRLKNKAETFNNEVEQKLKAVDQKILQLGKTKVFNWLESNPKLDVYRHSLKDLFRREEHVVVHEQIPLLQNEIQNQLSKYNNLLRDLSYGSIIVDDEEVKLTSMNIQKYLSSRNRQVRKQTFYALNQACQENSDFFAQILDQIYGSRIQLASLEKYSSVLEKTLFEENLDQKVIEQLILAVNQNLETIQDYLQMKAQELKIDDPHLYDFTVPLITDNPPHYTLEEAQKIILQALSPLGSTYLQAVTKLLDGHIDACVDENKHQSITFSWQTYSFMNFRGNYIDLKNLIHELGHIVNYYFSAQAQPFLYEDSTIFVGEIASLVNEILLNRYLCTRAQTKEEKIFYLSKEIETYFTTVFKQTMYTELENFLYSLKQTEALTSAKLNTAYYTLIQKYYGPNMIYDTVAQSEWTRLGHLYRWSYYPYKYATGLLMASTVVDAIVNQKTLTPEEYIEFLASGSHGYSLDLLKILHLDFVHTNILSDGFNVVKEDIATLSRILKDKK